MVTAIDLPGRWQQAEAMSALTSDDFVESIGQVLKTSPRPVLLVGHSLGGASISLAAERYPAQIRRLVYLSAFLVPPGDSVGKWAMQDRQSQVGKAVRRNSANGISTLDPAHVREVFYNDCTDDDVRIATQLLSPEPPAMGVARMVLTPERFGRVPRSYIECLRDQAIWIDAQRAMQAALPCDRNLTLDASHSPFFSRPAEVASALSKLAV